MGGWVAGLFEIKTSSAPNWGWGLGLVGNKNNFAFDENVFLLPETTCTEYRYVSPTKFWLWFNGYSGVYASS